MQMHVHLSDCDFPILGNTVGAALTPHLVSPGIGAGLPLIYQGQCSGEAEPGCAGCPEEKGSPLPLAPPGQLEPGHWEHVVTQCMWCGSVSLLNSWEVGQSQNVTPVKGSQHHGFSALLFNLATVKSVTLNPKTQTCCR